MAHKMQTTNVTPLAVNLITASQLASLLQVLGALVADYMNNPKKPMAPELVPLTKTTLQWKDLPSLGSTIKTCVRGGDKLQALFDLGLELKDAIPVFRNNSSYSTAELTMLKALRAYLATDSESALNYIRKHAILFNSQVLAKLFVPDIPVADNNALRRTVQSLVGRDGTHLTLDESRMLKETNPKQYQKYVELRKTHNSSFKASLTNYVRHSGKKLVPYEEAYSAMRSQGFTHSMVPGFKGLIDDQGRWYTKDGDLIGGVPNLSTYTHVVMNPRTDPGAAWEFKAVKSDGGVAYGYTANFRRDQSESKYQAVAGLMTKLPNIRKKWMQHVRNFDIESKLSVCAVVLEVLYSYAARIGSAPGRGAGTLLVKNASQTQKGVNLAYIGKDSIPTKHIIRVTDSPEHKFLVAALLQLMADKTPGSWLYTYEVGGKLFRVSPADVNKAFRAFGAPAEVTVHKLRTCRGTTLFKQLCDKDSERRPPVTEKDAMKRYKEMTEQVGKLLNHKRGVGSTNEKVTGTTAATSYIDSSAQLALWERWGFRPPTVLEKLLRVGDE
jgi:hypothetical protein